MAQDESIPDLIKELEDEADKITQALEAAYRGSAENGSFFRNGGGEFVPSVFVTLKRLKGTIAKLKNKSEL